MAYCLVIDGKPVFYTSDLEKVKNYASVLLGNLDTKRKGEIDIIGGYDPNHPKPVDTYPVLYRKCNRCLKMYTFPYFVGERDRAGHCCLHCREKRKAQYRNTYSGYNPAYVDEYIAKTFGRDFVVSANWKNRDWDARPTSDLVKDFSGSAIQGYSDVGAKPFVSPIKRRMEKPKNGSVKTIKKNVERKPVKIIGVPENVGKAVCERKQEQPKVEVKEPLSRRWSYHFVVGLSRPFVRGTDWNFSAMDGVRVVQHGTRLWSDYTLICYGKFQAEADEKIKDFLAEHSDEIKSAEMTKTDFGWE